MIYQGYTFGFRELRVQPEHFDCEAHLVDYTLTGAVSAREKFEVFDQVVLPVAVAVMHGFFFVKLATQMLLHHISMFEHSSNLAVASQHGDRNPNVAVPLDVPFIVPSAEPIQRALANRFATAFVATVFLFGVNTTARLAAFLDFFAATLAGKHAALSGIFGTANVRTRPGAIHRVLCVFFAVCDQVGLHHAKWLAAFFARKTNDLTAGSNVDFSESLGASTSKAAKTPVFTRVAEEGLSAILARFLSRHGLAPAFGDQDVLALSAGDVK